MPQWHGGRPLHENLALQWHGGRLVYVRIGHGTHFALARGSEEETTVGFLVRIFPGTEVRVFRTPHYCLHDSEVLRYYKDDGRYFGNSKNV